MYIQYRHTRLRNRRIIHTAMKKLHKQESNEHEATLKKHKNKISHFLVIILVVHNRNTQSFNLSTVFRKSLGNP
jgi:hypothetical protein